MTPEVGPHPTGIRRSIELFSLYRNEPKDPAPFYEFLARDTMSQLARFGAQVDGIVVDVGGGPGYIADAIRGADGRPIVVEYSAQELLLHGRKPRDAVVGDGQRLPLRTGLADVVHSSNVLEHVTEPHLMLEEMARVLRRNGVGYLAYTPWLSPWGGHETSPWHYLGGERAVRRYTKRTGQRPKNEFGVSLFELHMRTVRAWFAQSHGVEVLWEGPRYLPPSWRLVSHMPFAGEMVSWNHLIVFRRSPA